MLKSGHMSIRTSVFGQFMIIKWKMVHTKSHIQIPVHRCMLSLDQLVAKKDENHSSSKFPLGVPFTVKFVSTTRKITASSRAKNRLPFFYHSPLLFFRTTVIPGWRLTMKRICILSKCPMTKMVPSLTVFMSLRTAMGRMKALMKCNLMDFDAWWMLLTEWLNQRTNISNYFETFELYLSLEREIKLKNTAKFFFVLNSMLKFICNLQ